jgi:hypothetical protein
VCMHAVCFVYWWVYQVRAAALCADGIVELRGARYAARFYGREIESDDGGFGTKDIEGARYDTPRLSPRGAKWQKAMTAASSPSP